MRRCAIGAFCPVNAGMFRTAWTRRTGAVFVAASGSLGQVGAARRTAMATMTRAQHAQDAPARNGRKGLFLRNHWYVAAWSDEIGRKPLARVVLGDYLVLFRT